MFGRIVMARHFGSATVHPLGEVILVDDGGFGVSPIGEHQRLDLTREVAQLGRMIEALAQHHRWARMAQVRNGIARIPEPCRL